MRRVVAPQVREYLSAHAEVLEAATTREWLGVVWRMSDVSDGRGMRDQIDMMVL